MLSLLVREIRLTARTFGPPDIIADSTPPKYMRGIRWIVGKDKVSKMESPSVFE
jgi:hypothetical protein